MKINIKNLKGEMFSFEVEATDTVKMYLCRLEPLNKR